jgi:hypothetical protein
VATARLATMGHEVPVALAGTLIFAIAAFPAFIVVEVLLPLADDFVTFGLVVAPMIFCCARLMATKNPQLRCSAISRVSCSLRWGSSRTIWFTTRWA